MQERSHGQEKAAQVELPQQFCAAGPTAQSLEDVDEDQEHWKCRGARRIEERHLGSLIAWQCYSRRTLILY
jgi:hypothetical protein